MQGIVSRHASSSLLTVFIDIIIIVGPEPNTFTAPQYRLGDLATMVTESLLYKRSSKNLRDLCTTAFRAELYTS